MSDSAAKPHRIRYRGGGGGGRGGGGRIRVTNGAGATESGGSGGSGGGSSGGGDLTEQIGSLTAEQKQKLLSLLSESADAPAPAPAKPHPKYKAKPHGPKSESKGAAPPAAHANGGAIDSVTAITSAVAAAVDSVNGAESATAGLKFKSKHKRVRVKPTRTGAADREDDQSGTPPTRIDDAADYARSTPNKVVSSEAPVTVNEAFHSHHRLAGKPGYKPNHSHSHSKHSHAAPNTTASPDRTAARGSAAPTPASPAPAPAPAQPKQMSDTELADKQHKASILFSLLNQFRTPNGSAANTAPAAPVAADEADSQSVPVAVAGGKGSKKAAYKAKKKQAAVELYKAVGRMTSEKIDLNALTAASMQSVNQQRMAQRAAARGGEDDSDGEEGESEAGAGAAGFGASTELAAIVASAVNSNASPARKGVSLPSVVIPTAAPAPASAAKPVKPRTDQATASQASAKPKVSLPLTKSVVECNTLYKSVKQIEAELKVLTTTPSGSGRGSGTAVVGGSAGQRIADLRRSLRDHYTLIITKNSSFAYHAHVVSKLWAGFYRSIDEHLTILKSRRDPTADDEQYRLRLRLAIDEAVRFFSALADKVQAIYDHLPLTSHDQKQSQSKSSEPTPAAVVDTPFDREYTSKVLSSVYNCLGDLERYRQLHVPSASASAAASGAADYRIATGLYVRALSIDPCSGKAHNQLAVLATYSKDEFEAVYQYTRAICAVDPFPARDNLLNLYERNRQTLATIDQQLLEAKRSQRGGRWDDDSFEYRRHHNKKGSNKKPAPVVASEETQFRLRFVRLQAIIDTRISVEQFPALFQQLLAHQQVLLDQNRLTEPLLMQLIVLGVYCIQTALDRSNAAKKAAAAAQAEALARQRMLNGGGTDSPLSPPTPAFSLAPADPKQKSKSGVSGAAAVPVSGAADLNTLTVKACGLLFEVFGSIVRLTVGNVNKLPFLAPVTVFVMWLKHLTTNSSSASAAPAPPSLQPALPPLAAILRDASAAGGDQHSEFFRTGLARLVNSLIGKRKASGSAAASANGASAAGAIEALKVMRGFKPLEEISEWHLAASDLSINWLIDRMIESGSAMLYYHADSELYSAFENAKRTADEQHKLKLEMEEQHAMHMESVEDAEAETEAEGEDESDGDEGEGDDAEEAAPAPAPVPTAQAKSNVIMVCGVPVSAGSGGASVIDDDGGDEVLVKPITVNADSKSPALPIATTAATAPPAIDATKSGVLSVDVAAITAARLKREKKLKRLLDKQQAKAERALQKQQKQQLVKTAAASAATAAATAAARPKPLIVLDGPNIAMRHGNHKVFSSAGISIVIDYYRKRGYRVLCFLPEYYLDYNYVGSKKREARVGIAVQASKVPDNVALLRTLREEGLVVCTPGQDYDDSYTIAYARKHRPDAFIVSNDKYRDYVNQQPTEGGVVAATGEYTDNLQRDARLWLNDHLVTFAFVGDEYIPNPQQNLAVATNEEPGVADMTEHQYWASKGYKKQKDTWQQQHTYHYENGKHADTASTAAATAAVDTKHHHTITATSSDRPVVNAQAAAAAYRRSKLLAEATASGSGSGGASQPVATTTTQQTAIQSAAEAIARMALGGGGGGAVNQPKR